MRKNELVIKYITKLSYTEKIEIKNYLISKLNMLKDRVEKI